MKNLKKLFAVVIVVAMMATIMAPAFAEGAYSYDAEAQVLNDLGLYKGISTTEFVPDLGAALNRETGVVMLLRMFNLEADAEAITDEDATLAKFSDAASISSWAKKAVAYAVENGIVVGYPDGTFGPKVALNGKAYCKMILAQLGYTPDYNNAPAELADKGGLTVLQAVKFTEKNLIKDDLVGISYGALKSKYSDGKTVIEKLIAANPDIEEAATTAGLYEAVTIASLASVPAVTCKVGETPTLPKTVTATYSDKTTADVAVTWDAVDTTKAGTVTVAGTVEGTDLKASVTVTVEDVAFAVVSVTAPNAKQVVIKFSKNVDSTKGADEANYQVYSSANLGVNLFDGAGADATVNGDTVTLSLETGNAAFLKNFASDNKVVVKSGVGLAADYTTTSVAVADATIPTLVSAEATGNRNIKLTFTEPVKDNSGTNLTLNLKVDGGVYGLDEASAAFSAKDFTMTFKTYADLTAGTHKVELVSTSDLVDFASLPVTPKTVEFTYAKDTTIPTVSVDSSTENMVKLKFSKPVINVQDNNVRYSHSYKGSFEVTGDDLVAPGTVIKDDDQTYEVTFGTPFAPGTTNVYISYSSSTGTKIQDGYGNVLPETVVQVVTTADTTAPTISSASSVTLVDDHTLDVTFTENVDLTTSQDVTKYTLKDSSASAVTIISAARQADQKVVRLTTNPLNGGAYTLTVKDVKDQSVAANAMAEKTISLAVDDKIAPTVSDLLTPGGTATDALLISGTKKVKIGFSEAMKKASIESKDNYLYQGTALATEVTATAAADLKSVVLDFTNAATVVAGGGVVTVGRVEDTAGNKIAAMSTAATLQGSAKPTFDKIQVVAKNQIKVTFQGIITGYLTTDFAVDVNNSGTFKAPAGIVSGTVNSDSKTEIILQTQDDMLTGSWGANAPRVMTVANSANNAALNADATGAQDEFSAKVNFAATAATDLCKPSLVDTDPVYTADTNGNGKLDAIVVKFNENIALTSLSDATFTVAGFTVASVTTDADGNVAGGADGLVGPYVVINVNENSDANVFDTNLTPAVTKVSSVKDTAGNVFDGMTSATSPVDKAAPVIVKATRVDANNLTLTFSEPVYTTNTPSGSLVASDISVSPAGTCADVEDLATITHYAGSNTATATTTTAIVANTSSIGAKTGASIYDGNKNAMVAVANGATSETLIK